MRDSVRKRLSSDQENRVLLVFLGQKTALKRSIGAVTLDASKTSLIIHDTLLWNTFFYSLFCSVKVVGLAAAPYYSSEDVRLLCNANAITRQIL